MSVEVITESGFLWYSIWTFAQNYLKQTQKMKKLLNQFNNFCYLRKSFNLKMQDLFVTVTVETSNRRKYLKCGTKFYKKSISRLQIIEFIQ